MLKTFIHWVRKISAQLFTESNGTKICPIRLFGFIFVVMASITYLILAYITVLVYKQPLDYVGFGTGISAIWGVYGGAISMKSFTEYKSFTQTGGGP